LAETARLAGPCHVVGHSLGGILALRNAAGARSIATLGSALNYSVGSSVFARLLPLEAWLPLPKVLPARLVHKLMAPIWASGLIPSPVYENRNMSFKGGLAFHCNQGDLSAGELRELGRRMVTGPHELPELRAPWLCVAAEKDNQCPPATARWTYERLRAPKKDWLLIEGAAHVDLVIGLGAERVWSEVENAMMAVDDV
jgi:pimeloyl-ACP methyl ester carboxylesterase